MAQYIATFHTHLSALRTNRTLADRGIPSNMAPVPRKLSSSCGTCLRYQAPTPCLDAMDRDMEAIYLVEEQGLYTQVHHS